MGDTFELIQNGILFAGTGFGFIYGAVKFFRKDSALFNQLVVCALSCMMMGRFFNLVLYLCNGSIPDGFHVGRLGIMGGFLFLFSASFGQMDGLVDGGEKEFMKYRIISFVAPLVIIVMYVPILISNAMMEIKIVNGITFLFMAQASYFNLKHILIPDIDMGILKCIKGYNILALLMGVACASEMLVKNMENVTATIVFTVVLSVIYISIIPVLERGSKKWII